MSIEFATWQSESHQVTIAREDDKDGLNKKQEACADKDVIGRKER